MKSPDIAVFSITLQPQVTLEGALILDLSHRPQGWRQHRIRELIAAGLPVAATTPDQADFDFGADAQPFRIRVRLDATNSATDRAAWDALQTVAPIRRSAWVRHVLLSGFQALQSSVRPPAPTPVQIVVPAAVQAPPVDVLLDDTPITPKAPVFAPLTDDVRSKLGAMFS